MKSAESDVLDIAYAEVGDEAGLPVVLIHGWPDTARGWREVAEGLARSGWRVIMPDNRGTANTAFRSPTTPRDGQAVALAQDTLDLADALGLRDFSVVGHDWGARVAYTLAALAPERLVAIAAVGVAYQPRGRFLMPDFPQARAFWYQWLMYVDEGAASIRRHPLAFARQQWDTWSPPGWFNEEEFAATATGFTNPDWVDITLNAYRSRFLLDEPRDSRYDDLRRRLSTVELLSVPTLMLQGGSDYCVHPSSSEGLEPYFSGPYGRVALDGVGHFPHREAPAQVTSLVHDHLTRHHT